MGFIGDMFGGGGGDTADASRDAANIQAQAQREALDYTKEFYQPVQNLQSWAAPQIQSMLSGDYDPTTNPMYGSMIGMVNNNAATNESIRGGNAQGAVAGVAPQLYQQSLGNLMGVMGMNSGANQIANQMAGIGQTQAQGLIGAAQSQQAGNQAGMGNMMGIANLGMQAYSMFSDSRLKNDITKVSETSQPGISFYKWKWSDSAKVKGLSGDDSGYLAHEVELVWPELVTEQDGFKKINKKAVEERLNVLQ